MVPAGVVAEDVPKSEMPMTNQAHMLSLSGIRRPEIQPSETTTIVQTAADQTNRLRGFSFLEMAVVITIFLILAAILIPSGATFVQYYRSSSNVRDIASQLALAKMTAASNFTQAELNCTLTGNSCQMEVCATKGATVCTTYSNVGGAILLSQGVSFGFGSISTAAGTQTTIQNTSPIVFNSRSIPIDNTATPTGNDALYLTDKSGVTYAVSVYASGKVAVWRYNSGTWKSL